MFEGLSNFTNLLRQAQEIRGRMQQIPDELKRRRVTGSAGGSMVEVEMNGVLEVLACRIQPQLLADGDREMLEDLLVAVVNQAIAKAKQLHGEAIKDLSGGMSIPGLDEMLARFTGGGPAGAASGDVPQAGETLNKPETA